MSKSLGNFFTLHELFERFDPMVVRYYFLTHHYRAPIEFSFDVLESAQKSYEKLIRIFENVEIRQELYEHPLIIDMLYFLQDDINIPGFFGLFFENAVEIQKNKQLLGAVKNIFVTILGLTLELLKEKKIIITEEIQQLINERNKARQEKNWKRADELRNQLISLGIDLHDEKI